MVLDILTLGLEQRLASSAPPPRVLLLGDADFAYATALSTKLGSHAKITATAFEEEDALLVRYPHAASSMAALRSMGATVRCGIDGRRVEVLDPSKAWERVVFNLPQSPAEPKARNQIQRHRALLRELCVSCANHLAPEGELWITLLSGQGGTPLDPVQRATGDTWRIQEQAAFAGLLVSAVAAVDLGALEAAGYAPTGRRANQPLGKRRKAKGLIAHVLTAAQPEAHESAPRGVAPLEYTLDNSFWLGDGEDAPTPAELLARCRDALGAYEAHALSAEPALIDSYERPEDGRRARTYRFVYRSSVLPLCRERALELNSRVCAALSAHDALAPRIPSPQTIDEHAQVASERDGHSSSAASSLGDGADASSAAAT